ncbi:hypothetical protein SIO70_24300 [Chitinophaga sancti]|uniref:hypothetical protein n=1 Tax=Chitinophaga sancti TaxID=1004 RepID=UPI002A7511FA|nr:hypothetical protein [Chitinophaga sancti]WPQ61484.1 hypothetical protein SIO70_24300 [Chitinophaga sancti]
MCAYIIPKSYAQTASIVYSTGGLPTTTCNVFNTAVYTIGGSQHYPVAGGVAYNGSGGIVLTTLWSTSSTSRLGTAYAIQYPFVAGHSYNISITASSTAAAGDLGVPMYATFFNTLPAASQTNPTACGGVPEANYGTLQTGNMLYVPPGTAAADYGFQAFNPGSNYNGIILLAAPTQGTQGVAKVTITRVTISESMNFTMKPTTINKVCGTALYQPVGVNEAVTGAVYNFILGANNGYTYGGAPAPAVISTPSQAIALTADPCSPALTPVTATVNVGGNIYPVSGTVPVNNTMPSLTISGSTTSICTNATFTVNNPCGTVAWSASPAGIVSLAPNGSSVVVTKIGNGSFQLTATVSGSCFTTPKATGIALTAGLPTNPVISNVQLVPYPYYGISASVNNYSAGTFNWYVDGVLKKTTSSGYVDVIPVGNCGVQHRLQVQATTSCGEAWSDPVYWTNPCNQ